MAFVKQERYKTENDQTMDKIDQWARDKTRDQFRTIMWAMCEKYEARLGKKDKIVNEVNKMADYMNRWLEYEKQWAKEDELLQKSTKVAGTNASDFHNSVRAQCRSKELHNNEEHF